MGQVGKQPSHNQECWLSAQTSSSEKTKSTNFKQFEQLLTICLGYFGLLVCVLPKHTLQRAACLYLDTGVALHTVCYIGQKAPRIIQ